MAVTSFPSRPSPAGGPAACAAMIAATLSGGDRPLRTPALLTAATWLWLAGRAESPRQAMANAREALDSGRANALRRAGAKKPPLVFAHPPAPSVI